MKELLERFIQFYEFNKVEQGKAFKINEAIEAFLILNGKQLEQPVRQLSDPYPDSEADGIVFCGKCGKKL